jgi:pheromone shutdown protein TraB
VYATTSTVPLDLPPVLLLGVAHVVDLSAPLHRLLDARPLDGIGVELDEERLRALLQPEAAAGGRASGPFLLRLWAHLQSRLGEELGAGAGAEMRTAAEIARDRKLPVLLLDDPVRETIARLLRSLSFKERIALAGTAVMGLFLPGGVVREQLEEYQASPATYVDQLRSAFPTVSRVLLDERNDRMAIRIADARRRGIVRIAAVVGDAHLPGLGQALVRRGIPVEALPFSQLRATGR